MSRITLKIYALLLLFPICLVTVKQDGICSSRPTKQFLLSANGALKVSVVAPASGCENQVVEKLSAYKDLKMSPLLNVLGASPFHSNTDDNRASDLIAALHDHQKYIWALRGGYGSAKLIPYLSPSDLPNNKVIIGYSDITALHLFVNKHGLKSIHGANLNELLYTKDKDPMNFVILKDVMLGKRKKLRYQNIKPLNKNAKNAVINASLIGGNLELITNSIGTIWQIDTKDKIVFIEDVGIKGYALDRSLNHLIQAGLLEDIKAILFGTFQNGDEFVEFVIKKFADKIDIPVYASDQFGHGYKNYPLIFGTKAKIASGELLIDCS
ncbi:LD-carboxypeptidase [Rickettsiales endosymbiont of Peranema trichophorum]|uniref:LD-carboxypeptidase n=1 Tax=Rickettsiales endosymbiont of Peranema trichophorum TaxID=2486577 RepID=UPI001023D632|nr:LD-carboxypeptidase [Rickettsiales endosymbiont of Peranema trichophorum]RZI46778.1 LD-carboxypeptidase [Rickettsiales endosymbiont of Peranema trichophorum]